MNAKTGMQDRAWKRAEDGVSVHGQEKGSSLARILGSWKERRPLIIDRKMPCFGIFVTRKEASFCN